MRIAGISHALRRCGLANELVPLPLRLPHVGLSRSDTGVAAAEHGENEYTGGEYRTIYGVIPAAVSISWSEKGVSVVPKIAFTGSMNSRFAVMPLLTVPP